MEPTTSTMQDRLEALSPRLAKYAACHATPNLPTDDLIQVATEEILSHCSITDNDTYMLRLADWRMKNAVRRERVYTARIEEFDLESKCQGDEDDELTITDLTDQPEEALVRRELVRRLNDIIRNMKPEYTDIISMISDGKTQREIAAEFGTTQTTIGDRIQKIRKLFTEAGLSPALVMA